MALKFSKMEIGGGTGAGSAAVIAPGGWQGTAVPRTGLIENLYVNTELSYEEVVAILEKLTYMELGENLAIHSIITTAEGMGVGIMKQGDMITLLAMPNMGINTLQGLIFACNVPEEMTQQGIINGWNISISNNMPNPIPLNMEAVEAHPVVGSPSGAENDLLASLLSTTPFTQSAGESLPLEGDYDGSTLVVDELPKDGWQGTAVPNTGTVENIYINTALSVEEITSIMNNFFANANPDAIINEGNSINYIVAGIATDTKMKVLAIILNDGLLNIRYVNMPFVDGQPVIENVEQIDIMINGEWNPEFVGPLNFNDEVVNTLNNALCGSDNDLLVSLFSTTPFTKSKPVIDIKSMIDEKKIPLEIKVEAKLQEKSVTENGEVSFDSGYDGLSKVNVNVPKANLLTASKWSGSTLPAINSKIGTVYINLNLSINEIVDIIDKVTYVEGEYIVARSSSPDGYKYSSIRLLEYTNVENPSKKEYVIEFNSVSLFSTAKTMIDTNGEIHTETFIGWSSYQTNNKISLSWNVAYLGPDNHLLTSLISSTDITKVSDAETKELDGEYFGNTIVVTENQTLDIETLIDNEKKIPLNVEVNVQPNLQEKSVTENGEVVADEGYYGLSKVNINIKPSVLEFTKWKGTAVPNTGAITDLYINTALSNEEVEDILSQITYGYGSSNTDTYQWLYVKTSYSGSGRIFTIKKSSDGYTIAVPKQTGANATETYITCESLVIYNTATLDPSSWDDVSKDGWREYAVSHIKYTIPVEIDDGTTSEPYGAQNNLLSSLLSITPFVPEGENKILELEGNYYGSNISVKEFGTLDVKSLIETNKIIPLSVQVVDDNAKASNIRKGTNVLGIDGTLEAVAVDAGEWESTPLTAGLCYSKSDVHINNKLPIYRVLQHIDVFCGTATNGKSAVNMTINNNQGSITIQKTQEGKYLIHFRNFNTEKYEIVFFAYGDGCLEEYGFEGWNPEATYSYYNNPAKTVTSYLNTHYDNMREVFSKKPFVQVSGTSVSLEGEYDGSTVEISLEESVTEIDLKALIDSGKLPLKIKLT